MPGPLGPSDQGPRGPTALRRKTAICQADGACLGWLLIPHDQAVEVWPASGEPQRLEAGPDFPGLPLELTELWAD